MAEALAISAANLDAIEHNLGTVAQELSGVISNVNSVNSQVNKVEAKVASLNDEVKNLVKEIRETTIITNARQSIMYNNEQIEKKFGFYDSVRRTTEALISAIESSNITKSSLYKLREELILNNPNYWLSNSLSCIASWLLNDKENADRELNNAMRQDQEKTAIFFCLVNHRFNRYDTSINWLNRYLSMQDPSNLSKDFVTILDLIATGTFGDEPKSIVLNKIKDWQQRLAARAAIREEVIGKWNDYVENLEDKIVTMPVLEQYCTNVNLLKNNLAITSSYNHVLDSFKEVTKQKYSNKEIDEIIKELIYDYETQENEFQKDNLKNKLIVSCNGDREKAEELFKKQQTVYEERVDLINLLTNIVIYNDEYKVSNETQKLALALSKEYIKQALNNKNSKIYKNDINIQIDNFQTKTVDGMNRDEIANDLTVHLNKEFNDDAKDLIVILLVINILGIIGIFITLNNKILSTILIIILAIGDLFLLYRLHRRTTLQDKAKKILSSNLNNRLEQINAEILDYQNIMKDDKTKYNELIVFLDNLRTEDFINSNNERNIEIGDYNE